MERTPASLTNESVVSAVAVVQAAYNCTDIEAISKMQTAANEANDTASLDVLCDLKFALISMEFRH